MSSPIPFLDIHEHRQEQSGREGERCRQLDTAQAGPLWHGGDAENGVTSSQRELPLFQRHEFKTTLGAVHDVTRGTPPLDQ